MACHARGNPLHGSVVVGRLLHRAVTKDVDLIRRGKRFWSTPLWKEVTEGLLECTASS